MWRQLNHSLLNDLIVEGTNEIGGAKERITWQKVNNRSTTDMREVSEVREINFWWGGVVSSFTQGGFEKS